MNIQDIALDLIDEDPTNPNVMPEHKYRALVAAIHRIGFLQPIIVEPTDGGRYLMRDGHHRRRAFIELQGPAMTPTPSSTIPAVVVAPGVDVKAIPLALNNIRGEVDLTRAAAAVAELRTDGWSVEDLEVTGFSSEELHDLLAADADPNPDDVIDDGVGTEPETEPDTRSAKPFTLEIEFADAATYRKVRKVLRKSAGPGKTLTEGLLKILAIDE